MTPHEYDWEETLERVSQTLYGTAGLSQVKPSVKRALQHAGIDRLLDKYAALNQEAEQWMIPPDHRPACPLTGKLCPNWTCAFDTCVDPAVEGA